MRRACLLAVLVAFVSGMAATGESRTVAIENKTTGVLRGVYVSPVGDDNWHLDRLKENVQLGGAVAIPLPDQACRYDVRVLLERRPSEVLLLDVDICRTPALAIDDHVGRRIQRRAN